tara:strand:- start:1573 stop:1893 length:321 start_codon:yes stop_codon:yes gene_type:complete
MSGQNCKWNISISQGQKIAYNTIISILTDKKKMKICDLKKAIILRTNSIDIKNNNKNKDINFFLKEQYGGLIPFIDTLEDIGILFNDNKIYAILTNEEYYEDWFFI